MKPSAPQKGLPRAADPRDALKLLYDPDLLSWAADPHQNPHWHHARSTTTGADRLSVENAFRGYGATQKWAERALELLRRPLHEMEEAAPKLKSTKVPKQQPWDPKFDTKKTRVIYVPCVLRRVISAHLAYILTITSKNAISTAAWAYIPGLRNPVPELTHKVAEGFKGADRFHAKLDIRDCFNSLSWKHLRKSLLRLGYPEQFVSVLMIFVSVPAVERRGSRWVTIRRTKGAAAGLPESGILLNLLLAEIDEKILRDCGVQYDRYSDDLIIRGSTKSAVSVAATTFCHWAWTHGLSLKGVTRGTDLALLVTDVREAPLELLGVLIDEHGDRHIPQSKVDDHLATLAYLGAIASQGRESVVGTSKYAGGRASKGLQMADQDDLEAVVWGTHRYWSRFNRAEADELLAAGLS
ncbi:MAG: hypothetical protein RIS76_349, partial [Verrucomicrobiota bacterium]